MILPSLFDNRRPNSLATRMRKRRISAFYSLLKNIEKPINILDIGGTQHFWDMMELNKNDDIKITLANLVDVAVTDPIFRSVRVQGVRLDCFSDKEFDVAFSNSTIEHVGGYEQQLILAKEIERISKRQYLQTPNRNFVIEPHSLLPLFQFWPAKLRVELLLRFNLGWLRKKNNREEAKKEIASIRLMSYSEIKNAFPKSKVICEKIFGLTKSFVIMGGW